MIVIEARAKHVGKEKTLCRRKEQKKREKEEGENLMRSERMAQKRGWKMARKYSSDVYFVTIDRYSGSGCGYHIPRCALETPSRPLERRERERERRQTSPPITFLPALLPLFAHVGDLSHTQKDDISDIAVVPSVRRAPQLINGNSGWRSLIVRPRGESKN